MISDYQNKEMTKLPSHDEVKKVVCILNGDSACGPDGFSGLFFQSCWEIIGEDITKLVRAFFLWSGATKICITYQSCPAA